VPNELIIYLKRNVIFTIFLQQILSGRLLLVVNDKGKKKNQ